MNRAKTKNLIRILSTILCAVFAFIVGAVFANNSNTFIYNLSPNSVGAYLANHDYVINNEITDVPFDNSMHNNELSLGYSMSYDFDLRIKYHFEWSKKLLDGTNASDDMIILNFVDRDHWIVDEDYIYYAGVDNNSLPCGIGKGNGNVKILSGIDFVNPYNENYSGIKVSLIIDEIKVEKCHETYDENNKLLKSNNASLVIISSNAVVDYSSDAACAWYHYKTRGTHLTDSAFIIAYNYKYKADLGISYPYYETAYQTKMNGQDVMSSWLGGNREFIGIGFYVVNGQNDLTLSITIRPQIYSPMGELPSINPVQFVINEDWAHLSYEVGNVSENITYNYKIKANSVSYLTAVDSIQINSANRGLQGDIYLDASFYVPIVQIDGNSLDFGADLTRILSCEISDCGLTRTDYKTKSDVTINNSTNYFNGLYKNRANTVEAASQTFYSTITLTNNSDLDKAVSVDYSLDYRISNGQTNLVDATTSSRASSFFEGNVYYEQTGSVTNSANEYYLVNGNSLNGNTKTYNVKAKSTIEIVYSYTITSSFASYINNLLTTLNGGTNPGSYDVWVGLNATVNSLNNYDATNVSVIVKRENNSCLVYAVNNTNKLLTDVQVGISIYKNVDEFNTATEQQIKLWDIQYWNFYTRTGDDISNYVYTQNLSRTYNSLISYYFKTTSMRSVYVGTLTKTNVSILPNQSILMGTINEVNASDEIYYSINSVSSTQTNLGSYGVGIIHENSDRTYIQNFSNTNSYYVKFSGTYVGNNPHIISSNGFNYYIGIIRPGQIVELPTSSTATLYAIQSDGSPFTETTLSSWTELANEVNTAYIDYFN